MPVVPEATRSSRTIARQLNQAILDGQFRVGERLPAERALAERFKVSRNTIREAISELCARGLLVRRQGDGTYLNDEEQRLGVQIWADMASRHPDLQRHLLEFRQMLERRTAELSATRHTEADRHRLEKALSALDVAWSGNDRTSQVEADMALHRVIAESAHNPVFTYLMESLQDVMRDHIRLTHAGKEKTPSIISAVRAQHIELVEAILRRDAKAASLAARDHLEFVRVQFNQL